MRVLSSGPPAPRIRDRIRDRDQDRDQDRPDGAGETPEWWDVGEQGDLAPALTYDDAAGAVPDDPDPARMPSGYAAPVQEIRITRALIKDMEGKLAFWGSVGVDLWNMVDPYCAGVAADNIDIMTRKGVPLMVQSPAVVQFFTRASGFMLWTEFLMSLKPVLAAMIAHHITKTAKVRDHAGEVVPDRTDWSAYTAA